MLFLIDAFFIAIYKRRSHLKVISQLSLLTKLDDKPKIVRTETSVFNSTTVSH